MKRFFTLLILTLSITYVHAMEIPTTGWDGKLIIKEGLYIPFLFYSEDGKKFYVNDIEFKDVKIKGDSIILSFPVFDSELRLMYHKLNTTLTGVWYNYSKGDYKMDVLIELFGDEYTPPNSQDKILTGRWDAWFSLGTENESYMIGVFDQSYQGAHVEGTFLSETGDYRYLQGINSLDQSYLSTFDGAHAYLFDFTFITKDSIVGTYYSGFRWQEPFVMRRNSNATLKDPDSLTFLKEGFDKFEFELKDTKGKTVSLKDSQYQNKVVIVQIMGSWCPNCMDETRFFNELYSEYNKQGLEIVAIAFERNDNYEDFKRNIAKFTKDLEVHYNFVFGGSTKQSGEVLPMLNQIMSYPTAVFIDRKGNVRKIHTGFSGPATAKVYEQQKQKTIHFLSKLLEE